MTRPRLARLLIVDDHEDNLELAALMLGDRYQVVTRSSAAEALAGLDAIDPDLVILDIGMAPVDGIACLQAIRARPRYAGIPAVALTAFARNVERARFLAAGFQEVITKPMLEPGELEGVVERLLASQAANGEPAVGAVS